jgi:lysophospholipid acyltransferase (LPLAT)-like uncharacterized protein
VNRNKYDLAKRYPSYAEKLTDGSLEISNRQESGLTYASTDDSDYITLNYFMHKPTPSLPFGRWMIYVNNEIILVDKEAARPQREAAAEVDDGLRYPRRPTLATRPSPTASRSSA